MTINRMRTRSARRTWLPGTALVAALVVPMAVAAAPTAHADGIDGQFLNALQSHGINFATPQAAILAAHQVCDELDNGRAKADVANEVAGSSNLDGYHAGYFVGLSISAYCPRHHASP
ncbi:MULTISPECIES: DUF732 domain-containing protein [Mycobacterium]|uniref:DUF732 domain-containing protein n=1 Tax=Mycobacterium kiyosense TaxID=2871094 RepID=A0A9P3Q499_9MYCO|nr:MULTISPECIES: DUF732 domain-containing protein [Mycobacterium]BDB40831.1 hypothetical protein IWGMT90018_12770 [Mycobacterium kiyosense]BDE12631.1 hypothetical protein MKCMC460_14910 [Mycobacterium sp. 20KCMC460]GLB84401.1 hypothetical protein SRL2020028_36570 [Mycobacterium kiyosense]GLB87922.1 hypothetical protein SRL2020130_07390 [Mycobacterium kiyosense]GLB94080.1 hypothetical protein SRL2020226_08560 [Mycobacterium kiyosense]